MTSDGSLSGFIGIMLYYFLSSNGRAKNLTEKYPPLKYALPNEFWICRQSEQTGISLNAACFRLWAFSLRNITLPQSSSSIKFWPTDTKSLKGLQICTANLCPPLEAVNIKHSQCHTARLLQIYCFYPAVVFQKRLARQTDGWTETIASRCARVVDSSTGVKALSILQKWRWGLFFLKRCGAIFYTRPHQHFSVMNIQRQNSWQNILSRSWITFQSDSCIIRVPSQHSSAAHSSGLLFIITVETCLPFTLTMLSRFSVSD